MGQKIGNLQELYDQEKLFYHCNACGDINVPGKPELYCGKPEEMPEDVRELYMTLWSEGSGWPEYVVTLNGKAGMALTIGLYNIQDFIGDIKPEEEDAVLKATEEVARSLAAQMQEKMPSIQIFYGSNTDPLGDEMLVCLDKDKCSEETWRKVENIADEFFYSVFTEQLKKAIATK